MVAWSNMLLLSTLHTRDGRSQTLTAEEGFCTHMPPEESDGDEKQKRSTDEKGKESYGD